MPIECRQLTPKNIVVDILRIAGSKPLPSSILLEVGALFDFSNNAMRVTINRLMKSGMLERSEPTNIASKESSHYTLSPSTTPLGTFINNWKNAEKRVKPWQESQWLLCHLPKNPERSSRKRSVRVLSLRGFRPGPDNLWIRPDNLSDDFFSLDRQLKQMGLEEQAALIASHKMPEGLSQQWQELWNNTENEETYREHFPAMEKALKQSQKQLHNQSIKDAMAESFRLGSHAIHILTKDPLLPKQMGDCKNRASLCHTMLEYDQFGRKIWQQHIEALFQR